MLLDAVNVSSTIGCSACRTYSSDPALQARSVEKLRQYDFLHVLPGHGRRAHFKDAEDREQQIQLCLT